MLSVFKYIPLVRMLLILVSCSGLFSGVVKANTGFVVLDQQAQPLADAVIELISAQQQAKIASPVMVAQQDLTFVPFVSAVQMGSKVEFPNKDKTRHHVYSFSPAKVFELKLYADKPEAPILFDKAGIIALGCNIHDYMQAYIYVGTSPYLAVSDEQGKVNFADLPAGLYQVKLWHPWQLAEFVIQEFTMPVAGETNLTLAVKRQQKPSKPKKGFGNSY